MHVEPVTLEGTHARLEPLSLERHAEGLLEIGLDPELWHWTIVKVETTGDLRRYLEKALLDQAEGRAVPFAIVEPTSGRVIGSTRFMAIAVPHRRVEIGSTWIAKPWQRTAINTEAKYLMLRHAFETWGCLRVELKTDARNDRSWRAMLRLGLVLEGTFRKHMITERGEARDTVYFSVVDDEWPAMKARLERLLARSDSAAGGAGDAPARGAR
jgi:N-acetyltransferase